MGTPLFIPWFKLEPFNIPLAYLIGGLLLACALAATQPKYRQQAVSTALFAGAAGLVAFMKGFDPIPIQPFGILVATGVMLGTRLSEWYAKKNNIHPAILADFITHVIFLGFVGALVLNAVFYEWEDLMAFFADPANNLKWMGLSSYGGFVGAIFGVWVWKKRHPDYVAWPLADAVAFGFPLGWFFGRMGCFVVHDHPGEVTDFFLAVDNYNLGGQPRHDLGLYEVILAGLMMLLFLWLLKRDPERKRPMGLWVALMPLIYTPVRLLLDTLRATDVHGADNRFAGLTPAQYASIGMLVMAIALLRHVRSNPEWVIPVDMQVAKAKAKSGKSDEASDEPKKKPKKSSADRRKKKKK